MRLPINLLCLALSVLPSTLAVFADDAYKIDYHHELLGIPQPHTTFFHRPRKESEGSLLYTLSDLGVLGAVRPNNGKVVWRQFLAEQNGTSAGFLRPVQGESIVVSAIGSRVDAWDAATGRQRWGTTVQGDIRDLEVVEIVPGGAEVNDVLVLAEVAGKGVLYRLKGDSGELLWAFKDISDDEPIQTSTNINHVFTVSLHGKGPGRYVKVITLDPVTGKKQGEYMLSSQSDVFTAEDVLLVGANSASPIVAFADKAKKRVMINILGDKNMLEPFPLDHNEGEVVRVALHAPYLIQSQPHFLVQSFSEKANSAVVYHIDQKKGQIRRAYDLPHLPGSGVISTSSQDANVYFTRVTEDEVITVSSDSHAILARAPLKLHKKHGKYVHGVAEVNHRAGTYAVRSAIVTSEEDWVLVQGGNEAWSRPEGLSGAVAAAWAEIPETENLSRTLEEEAHQNPVSAYIHRVQRHISDLQHLPAYLQALPTRFLSSIFPIDTSSADKQLLTRDSFGFSKIVVVATQRGRIFGIDSGNQGAVAWALSAYSISAGQKWDVKGIWVENAKTQATIRGRDGEYVIVQTETGKLIEKTAPGSWPLTEATTIVESSKGQWFLTIGVDGNPGDIPNEWAPHGTIVVKGKNDEIRGLKYEENGPQSKPIPAWTFHPGAEQKIVNVIAKPAHDPVASIGRVLGDRAVLYKYLNPNTILVTAVSEKASTATFYLVETTSGDILYSETRSGVDISQPITSLLTENWFAYSLYSDEISTPLTPSTSKGYQIVVSDLYESDVPNYRGPLGAAENSSSLEPVEMPNAPPAIPHVVTQTFLISQPISHMAVTQTRQGITVRQLLCTIAEQNSIIGIPKQVLEPRRPVDRDANANEQEEGLYKYTPVIELDTKLVLTHKREVAGVRNVITTPALLESTSLVFAYGIDIFGTRVAPSQAFDVLGSGFNRFSLVSTVAALGLGVAVLAPLVCILVDF